MSPLIPLITVLRASRPFHLPSIHAIDIASLPRRHEKPRLEFFRDFTVELALELRDPSAYTRKEVGALIRR
ncbi:hypothetical protein MKX34_23895 [Paenibacillus sp. FSL R5-0636]|uniref:hypothetical protein n=1 Tax=Paenibacillus sp. FSL R5-0636 TaxID=2921652 RepID=UPI0030CC8BE3